MSKSAGRLGIIGVVIAGIAAAGGAMFSDCIPGFGMGGAGQGKGAAPAEAERAAPTKAEPAQVVDAQPQQYVIAVKGERCTLPGAEPRPCVEVCEKPPEGAALVPAGEAVEINGVFGSHGVVMALDTCLKAAGHKVKIKSD